MEDHNYICIEKKEYDALKETEVVYGRLVNAIMRESRLAYGSKTELRFDNIEDIAKFLLPVAYDFRVKALNECEEEEAND